MFITLSSLGTVLGQTTVFCWFGSWSIYSKSSIFSWIIRNYIPSLFIIGLFRNNRAMVVMVFNNISVSA